jgi:hypothetical protein
MAFKQGKRPTLRIPSAKTHAFRAVLLVVGYRVHRGLRTKRKGELMAWLIRLPKGRQVHVQEEELPNGDILVFAHTEPAGYGLKHLKAALRDRVSYSGGARRLRNDLRSKGWVDFG